MPRLLRKRKDREDMVSVNHSYNGLTLQVQVNQARNFTINEAVCNPLCLVTFNNVIKTTKKIKNSTQPQWKSTLKIKLSGSPSSQYLRFIVYDADNTSFLYLAECKISILSLFRTTRTNYKFTKDATWYPMFNRSVLREKNLSWMEPKALAYSIGELQLSFKLVSNNNDDSDTLTSFHLWTMRLMNNLEYESLKSGMYRETVEDSLEFEDVLDEGDLLDVLKIDDDAVEDMDLDVGLPGETVSDDEEEDSDDYDDDDDDDEREEEDDDEEDEDDLILDSELLDPIGALYALDTMSISSGDSVKSTAASVCISETPSLYSLYSEDRGISGNLSALSEFHLYNRMETSPTGHHDSSPTYDSSPSLSQDMDALRDEDDKKLLSRRRKRIPQRKRSIHTFEVSKREHSMGIVLLTLNKIKDLPVYRKAVSKASYDMDPFVIITFGRRVFKSSYRKRTLNPEYDEVCAFEIYPDERHFEFRFEVVDKDSFSFHDKVASASISWADVIKKYSIGETLDLEMPLELRKPADNNKPVMSISFQFLPYADLKRRFWTQSLHSLTTQKSFDVVELGVLLEKVGQFTCNEINEFFYYFNKVPWSFETLSLNELVAYLENWTNNNRYSSPFNNIQTCPLCGNRVMKSRNSVKSKLNRENDLISHFAICQLKRNQSQRTFLTPSYVSVKSASRRWFSKILIKMTYGKYALGSNNANILVQDRDSGVIIEEKISAHVKLGIRIIYNGKGVKSRKFKNLLRKQTIKQGRKFDAPSSVRYIPSFIRFHSLDMSECLKTEYKTFNEFFYRKLKPGSREPESQNPGILLSPADCRATVFPTVHKAQEIWIKGRQFTLRKLLSGCPQQSQFTENLSSIAIFRLAPQDYHRFHSPCEGVIGKIHYISGEYYTVNPMAVRTKLDVFGENVRCVVPITSPVFGTILYIAVGAMMVGSIIFTCKEGDTISRGQEMGYFKFGGSTIILLIPHQKIIFDSDLIKNSDEMVETLLKVGMSVGHLPTEPEHPRIKRSVKNKEEFEKIKRTITVTDENVSALGSVPWEYNQLKNLSSD